MDNGEQDLWLLLVFGALFGLAIATITTFLAVACTVASIMGKFPVLPMLFYWLFFGTILLLFRNEFIGNLRIFSGAFEYFSLWIYALGSPFFAGLFWYIDYKQTKRQRDLIPTNNENTDPTTHT